jgi:hypothetical protein
MKPAVSAPHGLDGLVDFVIGIGQGMTKRDANKAPAAAQKSERLAAALRANLLKRKAQLRERRQAAASAEGDDSATPGSMGEAEAEA